MGNSKDDRAWWDERTLGQKILLGIGFGIVGLGLLSLFGWVAMLLWNWLMPEIFGLKKIDYWQAWGLLLLSQILFRGFGDWGEKDKSERKRKKHLRESMREVQVSENESSRKTGLSTNVEKDPS